MRLYLIVFFGLLFCAPCWAVEFTQTQDAPINGTTTCISPLVRTFQVPQAFTIADVDLGFEADHTWRGDIQLTLTSPAGTAVQLVNSITTAAGNIDNYNIVLDDAAADLINTGSHTTPDGTGAPPYENRVRPNNPLSTFNGQAAQGTWTLEICDAFPGQDDGNFDIATLFLTEDPTPPGGGTPLTCALSEQTTFDWGPAGGTNGWTAGTFVNGYTIGTDIPMSIAVSGDTNRLIPRNGVNTPVTDDELTGGDGPQNSLLIYADFVNQSEQIVLTVNIGTAGTGVASLGFDIFDVDRNNWTDRVTIAGSLSGASVSPVLTGSTFNTVSGNSVIGTAIAASTSGAGNAEVVFVNAVDQFTITYDNGPSAPADPAAQVMSFFANLSICPALTADISAVKSVEIADPAAGVYMVPGNEIIYKITVTNSADATTSADDIAISDTLPDNLTYLSAALTGFAGGSLTEPSVNTDCTGGTCTVSLTGASLAEDSTGEIRVRARIQ